MNNVIKLSPYLKPTGTSTQRYLLRETLREYARFLRLGRQLGESSYTGEIGENRVGEIGMMALLNEEERMDLENVAIKLEKIFKSVRGK